MVDRPYVGPRHAWRVALVARALLGAAPRGPLVDVGCGDGTLAGALARVGRTVYAFDRDPERLARARSVIRQCGTTDGRVHVFRADATAVPLADGAFAGAAAGEVLEHVARDDLALGEIARILAPGGAFVATAPAGSERFGRADRAAGHVRRYDRRELAARLSAAGFETLTLRGWGFPFGRLYDRWVQRPAVAARGTAVAPWVRALAGNRWVAATWRVLFALDERVPAGERASGWLVVGRTVARLAGEADADGVTGKSDRERASGAVAEPRRDAPNAATR